MWRNIFIRISCQKISLAVILSFSIQKNVPLSWDYKTSDDILEKFESGVKNRKTVSLLKPSPDEPNENMLFLKLYKDIRYVNELAALLDIRHITFKLLMEVLKKK